MSGVSDSLRFKSSENSWVTGVAGGCCGVKAEEGPGRDWLSLGSSSVMSSQDCRSNKETQPWNNSNILSLQTDVGWYVYFLWFLHLHILLSHIVQVSGLQVFILQVFTDVASRTENTMCLLMDLPLLIVALSL